MVGRPAQPEKASEEPSIDLLPPALGELELASDSLFRHFELSDPIDLKQPLHRPPAATMESPSRSQYVCQCSAQHACHVHKT